MRVWRHFGTLAQTTLVAPALHTRQVEPTMRVVMSLPLAQLWDGRGTMLADRGVALASVIADRLRVLLAI